MKDEQISEDEIGNLKVTIDGKVIHIDNEGNTLLDEEVQNLKTGEISKLTIKNNYIDENKVSVTIPKGFKVSTVKGEYNVNEGLVIIDSTGNEFVWVPVGILKDTNGTDQTVKLGRYDFNETGEPNEYAGTFTEDSTTTHKTNFNNAIAKDIDAFTKSVEIYGGYYIGRYEAGLKEGTENFDASGSGTNENWTGYKTGTLVCQPGKKVWTSVTQNKASELAQGMYAGKEKEGYISDLINSYAWDTALVFIQKFSGDDDYSRQFSSKSVEEKTGETQDVKCNIYDMAENVLEWTTETSSNSEVPCIWRGGLYNNSTNYTSCRINASTTNANGIRGFRMILYMK